MPHRACVQTDWSSPESWPYWQRGSRWFRRLRDCAHVRGSRPGRAVPGAPVAVRAQAQEGAAEAGRTRRTPRPVEPVEVPSNRSSRSSPVDPDTIFDDTTEPTPVSPLTPPPAPATPREPRPPREPWLTGRPAAILTGLVVGGLIVAATAGSLRICTEIKGTSSCGGPGLLPAGRDPRRGGADRRCDAAFRAGAGAGQHQLPGRRAAQRCGPAVPRRVDLPVVDGHRHPAGVHGDVPAVPLGHQHLRRPGQRRLRARRRAGASTTFVEAGVQDVSERLRRPAPRSGWC